MAAKKLIAQPEFVNPALPFTTIEIDGVIYKMCFQHRALARAEDALLKKGHDVNMLVPMLRRTYSTTRVLFAASLYTYHPDLDFEAAQDLCRPDNVLEIMQACDAEWKQAMPETKPSDPHEPAA